MPIVESILKIIQDWFLILLTPAGAWQIGAVIFAAIAGWFAHRRWEKVIDRKRGERKGFRRMAVRGTGRAVFPFTAFVVTIARSGILSRFEG